MKKSAGILVYRYQSSLEFFLVHPGGPFWKNKDEGAWSIPKGEFEEGEDPLKAATREIEEETGIIDLDIHQYIGKIQYKYFRADGIRSEKEVKFYFATTPVREVVISNEHEGFKWTTYQEALSMLDHRQLKSIILKGRRRGLY